MNQTITAIMVAAGMLAIAGCGGDDSPSPTRKVDTAAVETAIDEQLSTPAVEVTGVDCPPDVTVDVGATFTCSVSWNNGAAGKAKVTQESLTKLTYEALPGSVKVPGANVEKSIEQELVTQGAPNGQADCPDTITVKLDSPITCDLNTAGGNTAGTVTFMFSEDSGTVDPSSVETEEK
jgi:hypothetical protein